MQTERKRERDISHAPFLLCPPPLEFNFQNAPLLQEILTGIVLICNIFNAFQVDPSLQKKLPVITKWLGKFLAENVVMIANQVARNQLILSVS